MLGFGINAVLGMAETPYPVTIRGLTPRDAVSVESPALAGILLLLTPLGGAILLPVSELISYH